jgi:hypothetical protein
VEQPAIPVPAHDISFLQTFLARGRRLALATGQTLPKTVCGACLFSDISGFTPLTEPLRKSLQPRQGAEVLNSIINSVFEALISQVHRCGGDVLGFAADAFTCWFEEQESGENDALRWAGWREPRYLELVESARRTLDQQKLLEMYREADTLLIEAVALAPFKYLCSHILLKPWVKRFPVSAIGWWYLSKVILERES